MVHLFRRLWIRKGEPAVHCCSAFHVIAPSADAAQSNLPIEIGVQTLPTPRNVWAKRGMLGDYGRAEFSADFRPGGGS